MAALAMAATLPLAGPVLAETDAPAAVLAAVDSAITIAPRPAPAVEVAPEAAATPQFETIGEGMASYYGREFAGSRTASGARFDPAALTAAHRTLPFGTQVQVTNEATGDSVIVTINDRGPFHGNRVIDLSRAAADEIGLTRAGRGMVQLAVLTDTPSNN
ncbi:septal ring lytic transglycosylase RlpA family protein [Novosphingobium album (ex Hu et al. 2023)]|uniref:Endolytic peptidoglycan transglycosylase RlpA n=1 Tax=Novosphingobium album (ex Hu et al. 2023) TaxID=2930093 RepID=A0ABT0B1C1_9SPHN|nr:septal ring lytic transglycosylase RlpA family protein [Novosphingobium album (ex Hu et al. 2023)]MCJ2178867.1 septal ring lytic transglycosylase RlpA family protein [Novosphingobium album (ex Hu et al. 2023)]